MGYYLTAFKTLKDAEDFLLLNVPYLPYLKGNKETATWQIFESEGRYLVGPPPPALTAGSLTLLTKGEVSTFEELLSRRFVSKVGWPGGTLMFKEIKLIRQIYLRGGRDDLL